MFPWLKRIFIMSYGCPAFGWPYDYYYVEPAPTAIKVMDVNKMPCRRFQMPLFAAVDRVLPCGEVFIAPCLDFHEYDHRAVQHDQVDFSPPADKIACQVPIAQFLQISPGQPFTLAPQFLPMVAFGAFFLAHNLLP